MKCPYCLHNFTPRWMEQGLGRDTSEWQAHYQARAAACPNPDCGQMVIEVDITRGSLLDREVLWPRTPARAALPPSVPAGVASDFQEAVAVLTLSPKASAALSRRCLQHLLRDYAGVKKANLSDEIEEAMTHLPTHLAEAIDGVRVVGNFAAHPIKSRSSGEVVDVEAGEAEWLLDTVEALIDHYIVAPAALRARREALNAKLDDAGKPPLK